MKYRKKPVVIEAIEYSGPTSIKRMVDVWGDQFLAVFIDGDKWSPHRIRTLEGDHHMSTGDYIIKGVKGEFYPCKPDIFKMSYEPAE